MVKWSSKNSVFYLHTPTPLDRGEVKMSIFRTPLKSIVFFMLTLLLFGFSHSTTIKPNSSKIIGEDSVFVGYPVPTDEHLLFYIQKSFNQNTVVYALNLDQDGKINASNPIKVFWRRYQEDGRIRELTQLEKTFGFGVKAKPVKAKPNTYIFSIVALKDKQFVVTQTEQGKPYVITSINDKNSLIERVYIKAEHTKLLPKVFYLEVFGTDIKTKKPVYQKIIP